MFLAVTLWVKRIRDHTGFMYSSHILLPAFGAFGSISREGHSFRMLPQALMVATITLSTAAIAAGRAYIGRKGVFTIGKLYIML